MNSRPLVRRAVRKALLTSCLVSAAGFLAISSANAQAPGPGGAERAAVDEIVVTGSRLRRDRDFIEVSPVQTIGLDEIQTSGSLTLEETLNRYPQLIPTNTGVTNQSGGTGVLSANLRNLGAVRTLTLVDGRRFVPSDVTGQTDMAAIPEMLVERVEIVTGGASAVYGSDAIAGAVNFILRDDFEGVEFNYQYGETTRSDGANHKFDLLLGANTADGRGNVTLHGSYTERDEIFFPARGFSSDSLLADGDGVLQPLRLTTMPGGSVGLSQAQIDQIVGLDFDGAAAQCPAPIQGIRFGEGGVPAPLCVPTDAYNFVDLNYLQRPLERWQITGLGKYEITDRVEAFAQMTYTNKDNSFQQAPDAVRPTTPGQETGTLAIPNADSNPLFSQDLRDFFAANQAFFDPEGTGTWTVRNIAYRAEPLGPRTVTAKTDSYNLTGGFRGDLDLGNSNWFWDAFYQYSRSEVQVIQANRLSQTRVQLGLDVVETGDGGLACTAGSVLGCTPVNFFGTDGLTPDMIDYLSVTSGRDDQFTRQLAGATIAGDLFELPSGMVASAFGVEWRKEEFSTIPSDANQSGEVGSQPFPRPNAGDFDLFEIFAEFRIPLLSDLPGVDSLALETAVRYSDYSTVGGVTTWKANLDWQVNDWARIRGGYSRAIRAPNLNELFAQRTLGFDGGSRDPCTANQNPTQQIKDFCVQQGVPADVIDDFIEIEPGFFSQRGGNPDLNEEEADTYTLGVVFTPGDQLSIALDYFDIKVDDAINPVTGNLVVQTCFESLDINSPSCQAINRLSSGRIDFVEASLLNIATRRVRGLDIALNYGMDLPAYLGLPDRGATLDLSLVATRLIEQSSQIAAGQPTIECSGFYGGPCSSDGVRITPDFSGLFRATWNSGPASLTAQFNYIGDLDLHPDAFPIQNDSLSARVYMDLNGSYRIGDNVRIFGGLKNVFDRSPPVIGLRAGGDSNTNVETFDPLGRRYFVGVNVGF